MIEFPAKSLFIFFFDIHHFQHIFLPVCLHSDTVNNCEAVRYGNTLYTLRDWLFSSLSIFNSLYAQSISGSPSSVATTGRPLTEVRHGQTRRRTNECFKCSHMYGKFCISYFVNYSYFEHKACVHVRARVHHVFEANYSFCNVCKRLLRDVYSSDPSLSFFFIFNVKSSLPPASVGVGCLCS